MNNWSGKKKVFALFGAILLIVGIIVTIFLVQKVQETRSHAEKATVLSLTPPNQSVAPTEDAKLDVILNPGVNQVNFVKFTIKFDPAKFNTNLVVFNVDPNSSLKTVSDPQFTNDGTFTVTLDVGSDATKVITSATKLGTILLPVRDGAENGSMQVTFQSASARSISAADPLSDVLQATVPATVTITGEAVCRPNIATCSWDGSDGATSYHYVIQGFDSNQPGTPAGSPHLITQGDTSETSVEFPSVPGTTYSCQVTAKNECGTASPANGTGKCPLPSETPTPTLSPAPTLTPTPTKKPTSTPTLTPIPSKTPTPTKIVVVTPTTPAGSSPTEIVQAISTPQPTLPPTGNPVVMGGVIGGILFVLGGLALLIL